MLKVFGFCEQSLKLHLQTLLALQKEFHFRLDASYLSHSKERTDAVLRGVLDPEGYHVVVVCVGDD